MNERPTRLVMVRGIGCTESCSCGVHGMESYLADPWEEMARTPFIGSTGTPQLPPLSQVQNAGALSGFVPGNPDLLSILQKTGTPNLTKLNTQDAVRLAATVGGAAAGLPPQVSSQVAERLIQASRLVGGWFANRSIAGTISPQSIETTCYLLTAAEGPQKLVEITQHCAQEGRPNYECEIGAMDYYGTHGGRDEAAFKAWQQQVDAFQRRYDLPDLRAFFDRLNRASERLPYAAVRIIAGDVCIPGAPQYSLNEVNRRSLATSTP